MLLELRVENLLLLERAELRLAPGLNAITGETGAGKTVLAHALDLLLGGRPRPGIVRPGASEAYVEGVFSARDELLEDPRLAELRDRLPEEGELVLARRVGAEGRTRAFVAGRSASAGDLRELGGRLLSFYGQHEHRKLMLASVQLETLDGFCGPDHLAARDAYAEHHGRVLRLRRELDELRGRAGARERQLDLLIFELEEIEAIAPTEQEKHDLLAARERLRRVDALRAAAGAGAEALAPEGEEGPGAVALLSQAEGLADAVAGVDPGFDGLAERLRALRIEAADLGAELRRYESELEDEPGRLEQVEERLELYERLERKHGGSVEATLAHAERCRAERERLEGAEVALEEASEALTRAVAEQDERAAALSAARRRAAPRLAARVRAELAELAMDAPFSVEVRTREGRGPAGDDAVEFFIAPTSGLPPGPLKETASGGELSRAMLALFSAAGAGGAQTLAFDEVDAGVGGRTARVVGERLRRLAKGRQVLCITHLPQVASLADRHFRIEKDRAGQPAEARVEQLPEKGVVEELCRMLGADSGDAGARRHAEELRAAA